MSRRIVLIGLLVALGAGLVVSLWPAGKSGEGGPDRYAQLGGLDVWRDTSGRLTFRWGDDTPGDVERYSPSTLTMTRISGRYQVASTIFVSSRSAWSTIHAWYGVTQPQLAKALANGTASGPPPGAQAVAPRTAKGRYKFVTDYDTDVDRAATASGLILPRLEALDGYRFVDAAKVPGGAALSFGPERTGNDAITLDIARYDPERPGAMGTIDKQMYDSRRWHHHRGPVTYSVIDEVQIIFPYRSEWIGVTANRGAPWAAIIRAILAAPTK
jgi:hypothetical protein